MKNNSFEESIICDNELTQSIIDQLRDTYCSDITVVYDETTMHAYKNEIVCDKCGTTSKVYFRNDIFGYDVAEEVGVDLPDTIEAGWYEPKADEDWHDFATAVGDSIEIFAEGMSNGLFFVIDNLVFACRDYDEYLEDTVQLIATIEDDVMIKLKQGEYVDILDYDGIAQYLEGFERYLDSPESED